MIRFLFQRSGKPGAGANAYDRALVHSMTETAVNTADPRIRAISSYKRKLKNPLIKALRSIDKVVGAQPEPLPCGEENYYQSPFLQAVFSNKAHLGREMNARETLRTFFALPSSAQALHCYALLCFRHHEKRTTGVGLQGEILVRDIPKIHLGFDRHDFKAPAATPEDFSHQLRAHFFEQVLLEIKLLRAEVIQEKMKDARTQTALRPDESLTILEEGLNKIPGEISYGLTPVAVDSMGIKLEGSEIGPGALCFELPEIRIGRASATAIVPVKITRGGIKTGCSPF
jgi:hypothetical protein